MIISCARSERYLRQRDRSFCGHQIARDVQSLERLIALENFGLSPRVRAVRNH